MKKKLLVVLGACLLTVTGCDKVPKLVTGCGKVPKLENGQEVVASIDGFNLTAEDLYEELKDVNGVNIIVNKIDEYIADKEIKDSKDADEYAKKQIEALKAQYEMYNMDFSAALKSYGYESEDELSKEIAMSYKKDEVLKNYLAGKLTDEEINEYYNSEIFGEMTVRHILIKPETTDDMTDEQKKAAEESALNKAKDLITKLNEGADFATLAKDNSDDTGTASEGGLFANFTKQGVDESFFDASYTLKNNEYTKEPVKSVYGYHIILKISQNDKPSLDTVKDDIKETLVTNKLEKDQNLSITAWDEIRAKYNMSINDDNLKNNYTTIIDSYKK